MKRIAFIMILILIFIMTTSAQATESEPGTGQSPIGTPPSSANGTPVPSWGPTEMPPVLRHEWRAPMKRGVMMFWTVR